MASAQKTNDSLTHIDEKGQAAMVDVNKDVTTRTVMAQDLVEEGGNILDLIEQNSLKKGDVLTTAQLAGIRERVKAKAMWSKLLQTGEGAGENQCS